MNQDGTSDINAFVFTKANSGQRIDWRDRVLGTPRAEWKDGVAPGSDMVKCTDHLTDFEAHFGTVYAWGENNADVNNFVKGVKLTAELWVANGCKYPFTAKGGSDNVGFYGPLLGHGKECDVDGGNSSDQSRGWLNEWELGLWSVGVNPADPTGPLIRTGEEIVVRCLAAKTPKLVPGTGPYKFIFPDPRKWYHGPILINIIMNFVRKGWL